MASTQTRRKGNTIETSATRAGPWPDYARALALWALVTLLVGALAELVSHV